MKRLIKVGKEGEIEPVKVSWKDIDNWILPEIAPAINEMIYRLAEYEKTGLAPDDVMTLLELYKLIK